MGAAASTMKARVLEREAATEKIFTVTVDVILYIFRFLGIEDRISFALSCEQFRRLCVDEGVFRKMDLSRHALSTTQRKVMNSFVRDRHLTRNMRELNISNLRAFNWQMDNHLQKFIMSVCPHLEALHVIDCGVSLQALHNILKEASQLKSLSWSIWDFTYDDTEFLLKTMESPEGICFKNIKHLHLHMNESLPQIQIAKYLVLSCCRDLVELEICIWWIGLASCTARSFPFAANQSIHQPSDENELHNLNSLVVVAVQDHFDNAYSEQMYDFLFSVLSRKSSSTKWKKFCISPKIGISKEQFSLLLHKVHSDDFHSVEASGVNASNLPDALRKLKSLFERIPDDTVRSLQLRLPQNGESIVEFCEPISRVGGHSLKVLRLSVRAPVIKCAEQNVILLSFFREIRAERNVVFHSLFSNCLNITELDLLWCKFEKDICESLSQLKHLTKVQLTQCAISSKYSNGNEVETSSADLLTFVENCKKITHLDVRSCYHEHFSCLLTDDDLLAFAKLRNLESLTLCHIRGITEWTFLINISENCKFLSTLRIRSEKEHFNDSHIPILMESSRFLKHLAIIVPNVPVSGSEVFWNLLSHAKNLERLCITNNYIVFPNIPVVAVEALKSLPRLHVLHLHCCAENVDDFYNQLTRMLEEKQSDCMFAFEVVAGDKSMSGYRMDTWINHPSGYSLISNKALPLNKAELCDMTPILRIPRL